MRRAHRRRSWDFSNRHEFRPLKQSAGRKAGATRPDGGTHRCGLQRRQVRDGTVVRLLTNSAGTVRTAAERSRARGQGAPEGSPEGNPRQRAERGEVLPFPGKASPDQCGTGVLAAARMRGPPNRAVCWRRDVGPNSHRADQWYAMAPRSFCHWPLRLRKPPRIQQESTRRTSTVKLCLFASHTPCRGWLVIYLKL